MTRIILSSRRSFCDNLPGRSDFLRVPSLPTITCLVRQKSILKLGQEMERGNIELLKYSLNFRPFRIRNHFNSAEKSLCSVTWSFGSEFRERERVSKSKICLWRELPQKSIWCNGVFPEWKWYCWRSPSVVLINKSVCCSGGSCWSRIRRRWLQGAPWHLSVDGVLTLNWRWWKLRGGGCGAGIFKILNFILALKQEEFPIFYVSISFSRWP